MDTESFIQGLPKTETHLHIEGALPYELLREIDADRFSAYPHFYRKGYRFESFEAFESALIDLAIVWYNSPDRYHRAASVIFQRHLAQNVRYVEISFHGGILQFVDGLRGPDVVDAIRDAVPEGLTVRVFMGMPRNFCSDAMAPVIEDSLDWKGLAGYDLHGVETLPLENWTADFYGRARDRGLFCKAHAGEFGGAANVREVIERLGVTRIQHGVRAVEDPALVRLLADRGIVLDVCPISNVGLQVAPSLEAHPLRTLVAAGVRCTLSTDDPLIFNNSLLDEYRAAAQEMGLDRNALAGFARTGFESALTDEQQRRAWLLELDSFLQRAG